MSDNFEHVFILIEVQGHCVGFKYNPACAD